MSARRGEHRLERRDRARLELQMERAHFRRELLEQIGLSSPMYCHHSQLKERELLGLATGRGSVAVVPRCLVASAQVEPLAGHLARGLALVLAGLLRAQRSELSEARMVFTVLTKRVRDAEAAERERNERVPRRGRG